MVIPASDIVTVDAGGRLFKTTVSTLVSSGAKFFQALLGQTGSALADSTTIVTQKGPKRARFDEDSNKESNPHALPQSIFVDRDPDVFADVLYFMRCDCISPKTASDPLRLQMLRTEADFFIYDALSDACAKQLADITEMTEEALDEGENAYSSFAIVQQDAEPKINVPKGHVLFITSATLTGDCEVKRYNNYEETDIPACYISTCDNEQTGDFQLFYYVESNTFDCCIAHVGLDQIHCGRRPMNVDFRQDIRTCISGGEEVILSHSGAGEWHVHYWMGPPSKIPQLCMGDGGEPDASTKKKTLQKTLSLKRQHDDDDDDDSDNDTSNFATLAGVMAMGVLR